MPNIVNSALRTIRMERDAIATLEQRIDAQFELACQLILKSNGRVVVTGIGKSGHIANKIASTLASTGTPAFFMHAGEASHGDLGMLTANDVVIAISGSGTTLEVVSLLPLIKRLDTPLIAITGNAESTLAQSANAHLDASVEREACPLDLAPTSSTTVTLVLGDALAVALLEERGFGAEDFAFSHPGGSLGKRLLLKVEDVMQRNIPKVTPDTPLTEALLEMSGKGLGMTTVMDANSKLLGIFTDGDLRRTLDQKPDLHNTPIEQVMTLGCKTISRGALAAQALKILEDNNINALVVADEQSAPCGVVHIHALIKAGLA
jgi:arabinose-5-phosphate isomerase